MRWWEDWKTDPRGLRGEYFQNSEQDVTHALVKTLTDTFVVYHKFLWLRQAKG